MNMWITLCADGGHPVDRWRVIPRTSQPTSLLGDKVRLFHLQCTALSTTYAQATTPEDLRGHLLSPGFPPL